MEFPKHINMHIEHNPNSAYYQTVGDYLKDEMTCLDADDFESPEAMARCIKTNELWTMQLYPDTPVGFWMVGAPTLDELLAHANRVARKDAG